MENCLDDCIYQFMISVEQVLLVATSEPTLKIALNSSRLGRSLCSKNEQVWQMPVQQSCITRLYSSILPPASNAKQYTTSNFSSTNILLYTTFLIFLLYITFLTFYNAPSPPPRPPIHIKTCLSDKQVSVSL